MRAERDPAALHGSHLIPIEHASFEQIRWRSHSLVKRSTPISTALIGDRAKITNDSPRGFGTERRSGEIELTMRVHLDFNRFAGDTSEGDKYPVIPGRFAGFHAATDQIDGRRNPILLQHWKSVSVKISITIIECNRQGWTGPFALKQLATQLCERHNSVGLP